MIYAGLKPGIYPQIPLPQSPVRIGIPLRTTNTANRKLLFLQHLDKSRNDPGIKVNS
jgi:hypothetical protein